MPVINPEGFVLDVEALKFDWAGNSTTHVYSDNESKFSLRLFTSNWDGSSYDQDVAFDVYFSDGRTKRQIVVPYDNYYDLEVKSTVPQNLEVTIVERTSNDGYFVKKSIRFDPVPMDVYDVVELHKDSNGDPIDPIRANASDYIELTVTRKNYQGITVDDSTTQVHFTSETLADSDVTMSSGVAVVTASTDSAGDHSFALTSDFANGAANYSNTVTFV